MSPLGPGPDGKAYINQMYKLYWQNVANDTEVLLAV